MDKSECDMPGGRRCRQNDVIKSLLEKNGLMPAIRYEGTGWLIE